MRCAECNLPVEEGDFYMEVMQKKRFGEPKKCTIHVQCIAGHVLMNRQKKEGG